MNIKGAINQFNEFKFQYNQSFNHSYYSENICLGFIAFIHSSKINFEQNYKAGTEKFKYTNTRFVDNINLFRYKILDDVDIFYDQVDREFYKKNNKIGLLFLELLEGFDYNPTFDSYLEDLLKDNSKSKVKKQLFEYFDKEMAPFGSEFPTRHSKGLELISSDLIRAKINLKLDENINEVIDKKINSIAFTEAIISDEENELIEIFKTFFSLPVHSKKIESSEIRAFVSYLINTKQTNIKNFKNVHLLLKTNSGKRYFQNFLGVLKDKGLIKKLNQISIKDFLTNIEYLMKGVKGFSVDHLGNLYSKCISRSLPENDIPILEKTLKSTDNLLKKEIINVFLGRLE